MIWFGVDRGPISITGGSQYGVYLLPNQNTIILLISACSRVYVFWHLCYEMCRAFKKLFSIYNWRTVVTISPDVKRRFHLFEKDSRREYINHIISNLIFENTIYICLKSKNRSFKIRIYSSNWHNFCLERNELYIGKFAYHFAIRIVCGL